MSGTLPKNATQSVCNGTHYWYLIGTNDEKNIINRKPSRMICRGAFDKQGVRGKSHGDLRMWAINDRSINGTAENTFKIVKANHVMDELYEEFAGMNMAEIMQDQRTN